MTHSTETRPRNHVKRYEFLSFARILSDKYGKQLLDIASKIGLDALKTASKKEIHTAVEATGDKI